MAIIEILNLYGLLLRVHTKQAYCMKPCCRLSDSTLKGQEDDSVKLRAVEQS